MGVGTRRPCASLTMTVCGHGEMETTGSWAAGAVRAANSPSRSSLWRVSASLRSSAAPSSPLHLLAPALYTHGECLPHENSMIVGICKMKEKMCFPQRNFQRNNFVLVDEKMYCCTNGKQIISSFLALISSTFRGKGDYHRLGHGTEEHVRHPRKIAALQGKKIVRIATGSLHCVACSEMGEVFTWGDNDEGQLGDGSMNAIQRPRLVLSLQEKKMNRVACGSAHTLAWSTNKSTSVSPTGLLPSPRKISSMIRWKM